MRYLGSKTLLLHSIVEIVKEYTEAVDSVFCDPFGGIGTVGSYMKSQGYQVISGDILKFPHYFQVALIQNNYTPQFDKVTDYLEGKTVETYLKQIAPRDGWFVREYAIQRKFFTKQNAGLIQACIDTIWNWRQEGIIDENEYAFLIASLIQSMDKVANTAGTYYAYLKDFYRKAKKSFNFELLVPIQGNKFCQVKLEDAELLVSEVVCDILYLDPPYNERNYQRYYHLPETIAEGKEPKPQGKSGVYVAEEKHSAYNKEKSAMEAFERLIKSANAGCIVFHYTDKGLINCNEAKEILQQIGAVKEYYFDSKGYTTMHTASKCQHHIFRVIK